MQDTLRITEIFYSLQGEARQAGLPTVFIRLTGCPLRCQYCDTAYAFHGGQSKSIDSTLAEVAKYNTPYVTVTGGEPLAQANCTQLLTALCDRNYQVSLETSGAIDISIADTRVSRVVDIKTPGSLEVSKNDLNNLKQLTAHDQIKFVICDHADFDWAKQFIQDHPVPAGCDILFSPSYGQVNPTDLAEWILADQLPVRFQTQLHKTLWGDAQGK